jgi:hypothetical protein
MDLACRRSLGPLRQFDVVNVGARPVGVSNGFMMAAPRHPFLQQIVDSLPAYNINWFFPYLTVMFSTGPMVRARCPFCLMCMAETCSWPQFLSAQHLLHPLPGRNFLRILDERFHRLNGRVSTPLFHHLGSSSWHGDDARRLKALAQIIRHPSAAAVVAVSRRPLVSLSIISVVCFVSIAVFYACRRTSRRRMSSWWWWRNRSLHHVELDRLP